MTIKPTTDNRFVASGVVLGREIVATSTSVANAWTAWLTKARAIAIKGGLRHGAV